MMKFDAAQLDARDRVWYYGLTPAYIRVVNWLMANYVDVYDGVSLSAIAAGTCLNLGTVRMAVATLLLFGYIRINRDLQIIPMHGFDLAEEDSMDSDDGMELIQADTDEMVAYDFYAIPQEDGTWEARIKNVSTGDEYACSGYESEAAASVGAMSFFQRYLNTGD